MAADAPAGGGAWPNNVSRTGAWISAPNHRSTCVGAWKGTFRRGFHRKEDRREALQLVCLSTGMEVAKKSHRKKLSAVRYSDDSCGLPELITQRNPNPNILKLFYGSDTMLREKEYIDSH